MVTEKMIEAAARAMCEAWHYAKIGTPDGSAEWRNKQDQYRIQARAALEAALSTDAEPVAWMHPNAGWVHHDKAVIAAYCRKDGTGPVPLYAAPPAPSVAVKALETAIHNGLIDSPKIGLELQSDFNRAKEIILSSVLRALSAQVQDVAGWQDISTAPKDGTIILLFGGAYHGNPFAGYWELSQYQPGRPWVSVVNNSKLYEHVPTHWMPLPAAPAAKLEEKP